MGLGASGDIWGSLTPTFQSSKVPCAERVEQGRPPLHHRHPLTVGRDLLHRADNRKRLSRQRFAAREESGTILVELPKEPPGPGDLPISGSVYGSGRTRPTPPRQCRVVSSWKSEPPGQFHLQGARQMAEAKLVGATESGG
jgi:hypothetical protein